MTVPGVLSFCAWLCLFVAISPGCSKHNPAPAEHVLRLAQRNEPATLDPQQATLPDEFFIIRALSEGLVTPDPAGGPPRPAAAESWETSPDGLTWTFHLRTDAQWSNGDPVTADNFIYSIRRALTPSFAAPRAPLFFGLKNAAAYYHGAVPTFSQVGVAAPDAQTLVITLAAAQADFLQLAASGPWIPVHPASVERLGADWMRAGNFIGNGPFLLSEWSPNQRIVVRKNPAYRDAAAVALAGIQFLAFDNGDTEERAFRTGQVDVTMAVPATKLEAYRAMQAGILRTSPLHETRYLALNTTRPPLHDVRVRRALSLALDRKTLTGKVLRGGQQPAFNFIPPGLGSYQPATGLDENSEAARRLLAAAGFPDGRGFPRLELTTWGAGTAVLEAVQQRWRTELGIEVSLLQREARTHLAALVAGDYTVAFVTAIPDYDSPADLLTRLTTGNAGNYPHWSNVAFDQFVATAHPHEAERVLLSELPLIPLYFNVRNYLLRPAVHGWDEDALWNRHYQNVYLDEN